MIVPFGTDSVYKVYDIAMYGGAVCKSNEDISQLGRDDSNNKVILIRRICRFVVSRDSTGGSGSIVIFQPRAAPSIR